MMVDALNLEYNAEIKLPVQFSFYMESYSGLYEIK